MAEEKDEILKELRALTVANRDELRALRAAVESGFARVDAQLEDVKNDIRVICASHLAPGEQKKIASGSGSHWETPPGVAAKGR